MTDADDMIHVAECELQQFVGQDTGSVRKSKKRVIRKDCPQPHGPCMQNSFMAETAQACMPMHNLYLLSDDNVAKDWEEREDGWEGRCAVDDEEGNMVDFEAIGEIPHARPSFVCMRNNNHLMAAVDKLRRELVDVTFDSSRLGKEEIADHGDVVRHDEIGLAGEQLAGSRDIFKLLDSW